MSDIFVFISCVSDFIFFILHLLPFSSLKIPPYIFILVVILKLFTTKLFSFLHKNEAIPASTSLKIGVVSSGILYLPFSSSFYLLCTVKIILNFGSRLLIFYFVPFLFYEYPLNNSMKFHCRIFNNYLVLTVSFTDAVTHFIGMLYISVSWLYFSERHQNFYLFGCFVF